LHASRQGSCPVTSLSSGESVERRRANLCLHVPHCQGMPVQLLQQRTLLVPAWSSHAPRWKMCHLHASSQGSCPATSLSSGESVERRRASLCL
ncbi:unnamed protein product, partial [Closterium sp. Naga37s-1]